MTDIKSDGKYGTVQQLPGGGGGGGLGNQTGRHRGKSQLERGKVGCKF